MIYTIAFLLLLFFSFCEFVLGKRIISKLYVIIFVLLFILLVLIGGTREVGFDYMQYRYIYNSVSLSYRYYADSTIEWGYCFLLSLSKSLDFSFELFLVLLTAFLVFSRFYFFKKISPYPVLSLLVYFPTMFLVSDMGQIRNAVAYSIIMFAYIEYIQGRKRNFWIMVVSACIFHNSAYILIPVFIVLSFIHRFSIKWAIVIFCLLLPFMIIDFRSYFSLVLVYMPSALADKFNSYIVDTDYFGKQIGLNLSFLLRVFLVVCLFVYRNVGEKKYQYYNFILNCYLTGLYIFMLFNSVQEFAIRFSNYLRMWDFIIFPLLVYLSRNSLQKKTMYLFTTFYAIWSFYKIFSDPKQCIEFLPYKSFFL